MRLLQLQDRDACLAGAVSMSLQSQKHHISFDVQMAPDCNEVCGCKIGERSALVPPTAKSSETGKCRYCRPRFLGVIRCATLAQQLVADFVVDS